MSLLNDMLTDLDARRPRPGNSGLGETIEDTGRRAPGFFKWGFLLAALVVCGIIYLSRGDAEQSPSVLVHGPGAAADATRQSGQEHNDLPVEQLPTQAVGFPVREIKSESKAEILAAGPAEIEPVAKQQTHNDGSTPVHPGANEWVEKGYRALAEDRLTRPTQNSATHFFNLALQLQPDNVRARQGMAAVRSRYAEIADGALQQQQLDRARDLVGRLSVMDFSARELEVWQKRLRELEQALLVDNGAQDEPQSPPVEQTQRVQLTSRETNSQTRTQTGSQASNTTSTDRARVLVPSLAARDRSFAQEIESGNPGNETRIREFLVQNPLAFRTRLALFDYYLNARRPGPARELTGNTAVSESARAYMQARLSVYAGDHDRALTYLEQTAPDTATELRHHSLAAALYQRQEKHEQALKVYSQLATDYPRHSPSWLGLAVAAEKMDRPALAARAYRQVVALGDLQANVLEYAASRSAQLSGQNDVEVSQW